MNYGGRINLGEVNGINLTLNRVDYYYLLALDTGSGTISLEDYLKRMLTIDDNVAIDIENAHKNNNDISSIMNNVSNILAWIENTKPILLVNDGRGQVMVEVKYKEKEKNEPNKNVPIGTNTLSLNDLETAFHKTVSDNNGEIYEGIFQGHIKLEDSLPWFEVGFKGNGSTKKAKAFCQQLAENMNIPIIFNRVECESASYTVYGVFDIDYEKELSDTEPMPLLSLDVEWAEFMEDYGTVVLPSHCQVKKKNKKKV